jgi:hypothetical protein
VAFVREVARAGDERRLEGSGLKGSIGIGGWNVSGSFTAFRMTAMTMTMTMTMTTATAKAKAKANTGILPLHEAQGQNDGMTAFFG